LNERAGAKAPARFIFMDPQIPQISQIQDPQTYAIIGAAMEVHRELGCGFLEAAYQEALALEFTQRGIPFQREVELPIFYKGEKLRTGYRVDFLCYSDIVTELKALAGITGVEEAISINYLKAAKMKRGLLLNFGAPSLQFRRFAN
jgi:GxxExxY protein